MAPEESITLKEHFSSLIRGLESNMNVRFDSMDKALILQRDEMERRLEGLNELRQQVISDRASFWTRQENDLQERERSLWRENTTKNITKIESRAIGTATIVSICISLAGLFVLWFRFVK